MPLDNIQEFMTLHVKIHQVLIFQRPLPLSIYLINFGFWVQFKPAETLKNIPAIFLQLCLLRAMKWKHKGRELPWHQLLCMHVFIGGGNRVFWSRIFLPIVISQRPWRLEKRRPCFLWFLFCTELLNKNNKKVISECSRNPDFFLFWQYLRN